MATDDLAPCVTRSSAVSLLMMYDSFSSIMKDINYPNHLSADQGK